MKPLFIILSLLINSFAIAQNIVSNSNFTLHWSCPDGISEIDSAKDWYQVAVGTPDYFNACSMYWQLQVPANAFGNQVAPSNAMAGIYSYDSTAKYREYIGTNIPPLIVGAAYKVTARVSLADSVQFATDGLGVFFYVNAKPDTTSAKWIPNTPQIDYSSFGIISDKVNWTTLTRNFIADSAYTHLVLGNFKSDSNIHLAATASFESALSSLSYYYIDSVAVEEIFLPSNIVAVNTAPRLNLYPNPLKDYSILSFDNNPNEKYSLAIYSMQGRIVYKVDDVIGNTIRIERNNLEVGLYYYIFRSTNCIIGYGKISVE